MSKQCMESCKFPSTYTIISGLLDDVNNSKEQKKIEFCHSCSKQAIYSYTTSTEHGLFIDDLLTHWCETPLYFVIIGKISI